jgi:dihydropteroate synthase
MNHIDAQSFRFRFGSLRYDFSSRTHIMGILNVTPDSFAGGGKIPSVQEAVDRGVQMEKDGADIIDVGGESTRPGSGPVSVGEELKRVIPVIRELVQTVSIPISIDTTKSDVAQAAISEGAQMVNDVSAGTGDPAMIPFVATTKASIVLMHARGTPRTMQQNPQYKDVGLEVTEFLLDKALTAERAGITQIMIDPGIGFGKTLQHNIDLIHELPMLQAKKYPVLVGPSRKSFIGSILDLPVEERLEGTAAAVAACIFYGAHMVRVHDVKAMKRVALMCDALKPPSPIGTV